MRCNLLASFLYNPKIVFLDEPTIGLDALVKEKVRNFLKEINEKEKVTILLTTHDMDDIEELCERIVLINKGEKLYDGSLDSFKDQYLKTKYITVTYSQTKDKEKFEKLKSKIKFTNMSKNYFEGEINIKDSSKTIESLFNCLDITDLNVKEAPLEDMIKDIYCELKR